MSGLSSSFCGSTRQQNFAFLPQFHYNNFPEPLKANFESGKLVEKHQYLKFLTSCGLNETPIFINASPHIRSRQPITLLTMMNEQKGRLSSISYHRQGGNDFRGGQGSDTQTFVKVEEGKFSYELENVINELSSLSYRGSISKTMEPYKKKLTMQDFSLIFREFARRGDWQRANRLLKYMQRQSWCKPTEHIYTIMIGIMGREGMLDKASELFYEMPAANVEWNVYSYTALINAYGRNGQYERSLELLDQMKKTGITPNRITYNTVINACAKGGHDWIKLLELFAQMRQDGIQPDMITFNTLLGACSTRGLGEEAGMVFRTMNELGMEPDIVAYTSLVKACERAGDLPAVLELLQEMEDAGKVPDVVAYNLLVEAYCQTGDYKEVEAVVALMQRVGRMPTVETYAMLLDVYGTNGRYAEVRDTVLEMKSRGIAADAMTYSTLVDVFGKGGHFKEAVALYEDMVGSSAEVELSLGTFGGLLYACGMGGLHAKAREIHRHMQRLEMKPSREMWVSILKAYGKGGLYSEAAAVFVKMAEAEEDMPLEAVNALLESYAMGGLCDQSFSLILGLEDLKLVPSPHSLVLLIQALSRAGRYQMGMKVCQEMTDAGHDTSEALLSCLIGCLCGAGLLEEARAQYLEMRNADVMPTIITYTSLLSLFATKNRWDEVERLLSELKLFHMPEEHRLLADLLIGQLDEGYSWQRLEHFLDEMKVEGIAENTRTANGILDALWSMGFRKRAIRFLDSVRERGVYAGSVRKSSTIWAVDLHRMSVGAGMAMLLSWLQEVQTAVTVKETIPPLATIVTKWGDAPVFTKELSVIPIRKAAHAYVAQANAPFKVPAWNRGRLVCTDVELSEWIQQPEVASILSLTDNVLPLSQPPKSRKLAALE